MLATVFVLAIDKEMHKVTTEERLIEQAEQFAVTVIIAAVMRCIHPLLSAFNRRAPDASAQFRTICFGFVLALLMIAA
jgi:uncharacterized membrane protein (DUF485 family)